MIANPHPYEVAVVFDGEHPLVKPYANRPGIACFLEMEGGMSWIFSEKVKVASSDALDRFRELVETSPKPGCCSVHLKLFERIVSFGFGSLVDQKVQCF